MSAESRQGRLLFSIARELTRVATAETEVEWLRASEGKTFREVQRMVSGRTRGDGPTTPKKPEAVVEDVVFPRVEPHARALLSKAREALLKERGEPFTEAELLEQMATAFLGLRDSSGDGGRAAYQVSLSVCPRCDAGEWEGGHIATATDVEVARCDAQELGRVDVGGEQLGRASQSVPPKVRLAVSKRHGGCCAVPGCTHRGFVHLHHIVLLSEGGTHDPEWLIPLCGRHHRAVHEGSLIIRGRFSEGFVFEHADGTSYGSVHARADQADVMAKVFVALTGLGFRQREAQRMIDTVRARANIGYDIDAVMKAALEEAPLSCVREATPLYRRVA